MSGDQQNAVAGPSSQSSQPRRSILQDDNGRSGACANCRSRKVKCSGDRPICATCAKGKLDCHYPQHVSRKRKDRPDATSAAADGSKGRSAGTSSEGQPPSARRDAGNFDGISPLQPDGIGPSGALPGSHPNLMSDWTHFINGAGAGTPGFVDFNQDPARWHISAQPDLTEAMPPGTFNSLESLLSFDPGVDFSIFDGTVQPAVATTAQPASVTAQVPQPSTNTAPPAPRASLAAPSVTNSSPRYPSGTKFKAPYFR